MELLESWVMSDSQMEGYRHTLNAPDSKIIKLKRIMKAGGILAWNS